MAENDQTLALWSRWLFYAPDQVREAISNFCFEHGANGLIEKTEGIEAYFPPSHSIGEIETAYNAFITLLVHRGFAAPERRPEISLFADEDWNSTWKAGWKTLRISERIWIRPSWLPPPEPEPDCLLEIDPEMAFGTGTHATTRLTLLFLQEVVNGGERVLDVGTGTGILAIAAVMLGAVTCVALDNDPIAVETARRNAEKNGVAGRIEFYTGTLDALKPLRFDRIVANIQRSILVPLLPDFFDRLSPEGCVILSGLLVSEEQEICLRLQQLGFHSFSILREEEWIAIQASK